MMQNASRIFPHNTPTTKEGYYYRMTFEKLFPQNSAMLSVPGGPSVACSTVKAVEWNAEWSMNLDPSGRAALGVHNASYERHQEAEAAKISLASGKIIKDLSLGVCAPQLAIHS